jgi:CheY-like chemotaxis protein
MSEKRQTILWVEDDEDVRAWIREVMELAGYKLLEAGNGKEALEVFKRERDNIELVVTDVMMPTMSGPAFVQEARKLDPSLKVVFVTAYAEVGAVREQLKGERVIQKPVSSDALIAAVRDALA